MLFEFTRICSCLLLTTFIGSRVVVAAPQAPAMQLRTERLMSSVPEAAGFVSMTDRKPQAVIQRVSHKKHRTIQAKNVLTEPQGGQGAGFISMKTYVPTTGLTPAVAHETTPISQLVRERRTMANSLGTVQVASDADTDSVVPPTRPLCSIEDLKTLDTLPEDSGQHYMTELDLLFHAQCDWVAIRSLKTGPTGKHTSGITPGHNQIKPSSGVHADVQTVSSRQVSSLPEPPEEELSEQLHDYGVNSLFPAISSLTAASSGSQMPLSGPPEGEEERDAADTLEEAASILESEGIAVAYLPNAGVRRGRSTRTPCRIFHRPLYFEDPNLERCGQGCGCFTTLRSTALMSAQLAFIPYKMTADPPCRRVVSLPDCPTCHKFGKDAYLPKWSWKAAAVQAGAVTGLIYIIP